MDKNSSLVGASNLLVKCHGEPEDHKMPYYHGKTNLCPWEIDIAAIGKKMGRIGSLFIPQCQNYKIYHS